MHTYRTEDGHSFSANNPDLRYFIRVRFVGYFYYETVEEQDEALASFRSSGSWVVTWGRVYVD